MEPTPNPEQRIPEADDRAEASLRSRIEELGQQLKSATHDVDLELKAKIAAHPWPALGIAFAAGALLALGRRSVRHVAQPEAEEGRTLGGAIIAAIGALALRALKDLALHQAASAASNWLHGSQAERSSEPPRASHDPSDEDLLRH